MNGKQILILAGAVVISALVLWHDLPIEFPGIVVKALLLFLKISVIIALAIFGYMFAGRKKKSGEA